MTCVLEVGRAKLDLSSPERWMDEWEKFTFERINWHDQWFLEAVTMNLDSIDEHVSKGLPEKAVGYGNTLARMYAS